MTWNAPNYCDIYNNTAALIIYDHQRNFRPVYFRHRPHPFVLPNHENAFELGNRLMKAYVEKIILVLIQDNIKSISDFRTSDVDDDATRRFRAREEMFIDHIRKCQYFNQISIQLGNLVPSEQLQEKALRNQDVFEQELPVLSKLLEYDPSLIFDSASKIDALYEQRLY
ncbi:unnamed protein product [Rotaria sp. Silwood1]|nr:unnamed protein product [Rotaria sp. Silwood1]CAF1639668.1 unnamed protein product [Rotaria sp. Silwood1]